MQEWDKPDKSPTGARSARKSTSKEGAVAGAGEAHGECCVVQ